MAFAHRRPQALPDQDTTDEAPPVSVESPMPPAPAALAGTESLTPATRRRLLRLAIRNASALPVAGFVAVAPLVVAALFAGLLAASAGDPNPVGVAAVAVLGAAAALLLVVVYFQLLILDTWARRGWLVGYFTTTSSQLVRPEGGVWVLSDHHTLHRGTGEAGPFRRAVFAHLAAEADRYGIPISMETYVEKLAALYQADMPGLERVGTRRQLGGTAICLRREPR